MEDLFNTLVEGFNTIISMLGSFLNDLVYVGELTAKFVARIPSYLAWLPEQIVSVLIVAFGVVVVYKILGREG